MKLATIHNRILKERLNQLEEAVRKGTPQIQKEEMIKKLMSAVNTFNLKERINLAWRIFWGKL